MRKVHKNEDIKPTKPRKAERPKRGLFEKIFHINEHLEEERADILFLDHKKPRKRDK